MKNTLSITEDSKQLVVVLLDDDELVRLAWEMSAKSCDVTLKTYSKLSELLKDIEKFGSNTSFYIDYDLDENFNGEKVVIDLNKKGFKKLFLATGHNSSNFSHLKFLSGVIGKTPPWLK